MALTPEQQLAKARLEAQWVDTSKIAPTSQVVNGGTLTSANVGGKQYQTYSQWTGTNTNFQQQDLASRQAILAWNQPIVTPPTQMPLSTQNTEQPITQKPTIATTSNPVIGTPPATTPKAVDFTTMTPEQLKAQYMTIGTKLPWEVTDEDRRFAKYLQTRMGLGETMDKIFGSSASSWTTTYSQQLNRDPSLYQSSVRNADGTYTVTYKDGQTQVITENPTKTIFPEWTPEYFAQKQADEAQKQIENLTAQMNTESERRKKETADLVAKYGENIAGQFASQKAEIEAQGQKRMDALNSWLSFSGFWRSTLAIDKRDEIAKNIETTITQAKAKADLELMAYRMEQEGADMEAVNNMRDNIARIQTTIDEANYNNQLEIIKLNQDNATTSAEAMNNLLETISNSAEIVSNADLEKSQALGYFVDKNWAIMLDSQKRPIQFEGTPWSLDPSAISSYADALKKGIIDEKWLDKLSPNDKAAVLKHVAVQDGSWVGTWFNPWSGDMRTDRHNNPVAMTTDVAKTLGLVEWVDYTVWDPFNTGKWRVLYTARLNGDGLQTTIKALDTAAKDPNKKAFYTQWGGQRWTYIGLSDEEWLSKTPEEKAQVIATMYKNEGGNGSINAGTFVVGGGAGQTTLSNLSKEAQNIIAQINTQWGKPQDYILWTSKDSQALLQEVLQGLNTQGGSGTLASDTRTQSLELAQNTIAELLKNKDFAGSFQTRRVWDTGLWSVFNLTANENVNFVNRVDALAGQLMQIDWPTLKAIFWPQISNSDIEMIKKTILQGLDPKNQNPEAFEKTLNDVKAKMQAYINRLPKNQSTGTTPSNTGSTAPAGWVINWAI